MRGQAQVRGPANTAVLCYRTQAPIKVSSSRDRHIAPSPMPCRHSKGRTSRARLGRSRLAHRRASLWNIKKRSWRPRMFGRSGSILCRTLQLSMLSPVSLLAPSSLPFIPFLMPLSPPPLIPYPATSVEAEQVG
ncbi:hypothetical protein K466DRAFT_349538 [Polyporus arcularius HHB13444]|uniref:Uncharacterized protein n=1 Tax=Polyporus arcularius HHB13444 TaxID=1314778 RepID=A0A5C3NXQ7_9APHY|nr:hypothetical protein K466DRAFT_349538 [Polyporus arcularius HHB13444]